MVCHQPQMVPTFTQPSLRTGLRRRGRRSYERVLHVTHQGIDEDMAHDAFLVVASVLTAGAGLAQIEPVRRTVAGAVVRRGHEGLNQHGRIAKAFEPVGPKPPGSQREGMAGQMRNLHTREDEKAALGDDALAVARLLECRPA